MRVARRRALLRRPLGGPGVRLGAGDDAVVGVGRRPSGDRRATGCGWRCDADLCTAVTGVPGPLAHPALVCDVAIGQSTLATQRVKANLFYRGAGVSPLPGHRRHRLHPHRSGWAAGRTRLKPGRAPTGLAALRMTTIDQADRLVLDFYRCAMLPAEPGLGSVRRTRRRPVRPSAPTRAGPAADPTADWDAEVFRNRVPGPHFDPGLAGAVLHSTGRRGQQRTRTGPAHPEHRCHTS